MTLIEVLAGLVVLGTLLVAVAVARARFIRQWSEADRRLRATRATDAMLATWFTGDSASIPTNARGLLDDAPTDFAWRTHAVPNRDAAELGATIVRLDVFDRRTATSEGALQTTPIVSVDLLLGPRTTR
jgi:type II secretory pathway pseudopilin PulG